VRQLQPQRGLRRHRERVLTGTQELPCLHANDLPSDGRIVQLAGQQLLLARPISGTARWVLAHDGGEPRRLGLVHGRTDGRTASGQRGRRSRSCRSAAQHSQGSCCAVWCWLWLLISCYRGPQSDKPHTFSAVLVTSQIFGGLLLSHTTWLRVSASHQLAGGRILCHQAGESAPQRGQLVRRSAAALIL
jgi:hypothetical protein